jgi:hypothetical protein
LGEKSGGDDAPAAKAALAAMVVALRMLRMMAECFGNGPLTKRMFSSV